ncbi:MAG: DUF503 domain-containing protein [Zhaonellaceae bacterium]|jgi:uncharacterized protein YlxP (DUF503 family)|nr:DUF503 domain-containing protein [Clostridia bacterium]
MMFVALLTIRLKIGYAQSLKDKRKVIKSLISRVRNQFNVSISEVADLESWHFATLGCALVTNDTTYAYQVLNRLEGYIESNPDIEVIMVEKELL